MLLLRGLLIVLCLENGCSSVHFVGIGVKYTLFEAPMFAELDSRPSDLVIYDTAPCSDMVDFSCTAAELVAIAAECIVTNADTSKSSPVDSGRYFERRPV